MLACHINDIALAVEDKADAHKLVQSLCDKGMRINIEGDFTSFLGMSIQQKDDGTVELAQTGLIDKILTATDMQDCKAN